MNFTSKTRDGIHQVSDRATVANRGVETFASLQAAPSVKILDLNKNNVVLKLANCGVFDSQHSVTSKIKYNI